MEFNLNELLNYNFLNNNMQEYILALAIFILSLAVLKIFKFLIINKLKKVAAKTKTDIDDLVINVIDSIGWPFYFFIGFYISLYIIKIPAIITKAAHYAILIMATYYVMIGLQKIIDYSAQKLAKKRNKEDEDASHIILLSKILKIILWIVAFLLIVSNLGYNISTLIAGLGVGGIAIAFALQNILSDIFASFSIYFDKPFKPGDFIIIGADMGVVKKTGIKSTRIQTLQGQELIVSNRELTEIRVNNYGLMEKRRILFNFGVTYQTKTEKLKKIPSIIKDIIDKIKLAELDRVHFKTFADSSLLFEVVYYIGSREYNTYMDVQQEINLKINERFEKEKIEMAYPTQTLFVSKIS